MKKSDLKDGYIIEIKWSTLGAIRHIKLGNRLLNNASFVDMSDLQEDLTIINPSSRVVKVFKNKCMTFLNDIEDDSCLTLIWERPREINWSKVPMWTKVQVKDCNNSEWKNAYLLGYNNVTFSFNATRRDKFTYEGNCSAWWRQCRIHPSVEIKEEWYK